MLAYVAETLSVPAVGLALTPCLLQKMTAVRLLKELRLGAIPLALRQSPIPPLSSENYRKSTPFVTLPLFLLFVRVEC